MKRSLDVVQRWARRFLPLAALAFAACTQLPASSGGALRSDAGGAVCSARPTEGCPCPEDGAAVSCFLPDTKLAGEQVMCTEGTRECRGRQWSGCEDTHQYLAAKNPNAQAVVNPSGGDPNCSICDVLCFRVIDNLTADGGTAGGNLTFGPGGGLVLQTGDAAVGGDAGSPDNCVALSDCCFQLADPVRSACRTSSMSGNQTQCASDLNTYCQVKDVTGPLQGCVMGSGADTDCDGIPNVVDSANGPPFPGTNNQTLFHTISPGQSTANTLSISYKLNSADIYVLFDTTGTMGPARQNLEDLLTSGNVVHCAELSQCCGSNTTCANIAANGNATNCYSAQPMYCGARVDCADTDFNGSPNNELAAQGVIGGIRCLIGNAAFGLGTFREIPVHSEPEQIPCLGEGCRYGDRDEQLFTHVVDMTLDNDRIRNAVKNIAMNYNWDEPEGGFLALNSVVTGRGHYFGINRPAVADRTAGDDCPANTFGYPCFRQDAVPIVIMFTDASHHNGPGTSAVDSTNCHGRGAGCPYQDLTMPNAYTSSGNDSASDRVAHYVPIQAERGSSAYSAGDVRGRYLTLSGNTSAMNADFSGSQIGCGALDAAPDAVVRFSVSAGMPVNVNFHLTKNDAYPTNSYGEWSPWSFNAGEDDPTPGTEFGAVVSVFRGSPDTSSNATLKCAGDPKPATVRGSTWPNRSVDFSVSLTSDTYYAVVKGTKADDVGRFQLQIGQTSAMVKTTYSPPLWSDTRAALVSSGVRVLPVLATGSSSSDFITTAEAQAALVAQVSGAVRSDGSPIWYRTKNDGGQTGQAVVNSVADLSQNLAMNVSVVAIDGPDSASVFKMTVTPQNSAGCLHPHPLVDSSTGVCTDTSATYDCNAQYQCRPGAAPKFQIAFTNPTSAPVPPNPSNPYGGYLFKLQLKSNDRYLLTEVPVFLIPNSAALPMGPTRYQPTGEYDQNVDSKNCSAATSGNNLPSWGDLYFDAKLPDGTSIDFQLCTAETTADLANCNWGTRPRVTVSASGSCTRDSDCAGGTCGTNSVCQYITPPKIWPDLTCNQNSQCPNGPLGSGAYVIKSRCETTMGAPNFAQCIGLSQPLDMGGTLGATDNGRPHSRVHITLHADALRGNTPQLYGWNLSYTCHSAL